MDLKVQGHSDFNGVYLIFLEGLQKIATQNLVPGKSVYGEQLVSYGNNEYRLWDPYRSKLAAAILKGLNKLPVREDSRILYLGAASGTTASHISDIVCDNGIVFCVEFASRPIRDLIDNVCKFRQNMVPIFADARFPYKYKRVVWKIDGIYCDISQPQQTRILVENAKLFLKKGGWILLSIKSRSIDVTKDPQQIYNGEMEILSENGFYINQIVYLEPFEKAHAMISAKI